MAAADEADASGTLTELAAALFGSIPPPGELVVQDPSFRDPTMYFRFLADLYFEGVKLHNGVPPGDSMPAAVTLRSTTAPFLRERMMAALRVEPILTAARSRPLLPEVQFIFEPGATVDKCWLHSPMLGFSLQMKPLGAAHGGWVNPHV